MAVLLSAARLSRISSVLTLFFHLLCYNIFYGVGYYTHSTMAGFIRLEPKDLDEDPTNLTVTLSMPKQYVEKDSIRIPPFSTNSTITEYTIGSVEENGENYTISIYFTVYDRTQTLMLPFTLSFLDDVVPDNYRLPVTASVFAEDYEMQAGGQVRFHAYTVYRDPEHTHVPDGQTKVTYTNAARSINSYPLDGETDDKIAYAFSDATIIAAQSMYAEKFIAPAGSDSWSKQGLLVKAGSDFDYLLEIVNETAAVHTGLTVYDTLPRIGDPNLFGASGRGSEFPVRLRSAITPPEGYTVYYTTSPEVYTHSMEEMVDSDIWTTSVTGFASVTAFKLVAGEGTELAGNSRFQIRIPVCAPKTFDEDSMALLRAKVDQDQASGTVSWLQAVNAFGFRTVQTPTVKESNTVWARVCFAGFCVKKVNGATQAALPGAEFTLTDAAGTVVGTAVSDADGRLQFRELTEGAYTLAETKVPDGFLDTHVSVAVTITQNPVTLAYSVTFSGDHTGLGTSADPLCIENHGAYVLPKTGGRGTAAFYVPGAFLLLSAALPDLRKRRSRKRCGSIPVQSITPPALLRRRRFSAKCRVCLYLLAKFSCICYTFYWKNVQEARHGSVSYH